MYGLEVRSTICLTCKQLYFSFLKWLSFGNSLTPAIKMGFHIMYFLPPFTRFCPTGHPWPPLTSSPTSPTLPKCMNIRESEVQYFPSLLIWKKSYMGRGGWLIFNLCLAGSSHSRFTTLFAVPRHPHNYIYIRKKIFVSTHTRNYLGLIWANTFFYHHNGWR